MRSTALLIFLVVSVSRATSLTISAPVKRSTSSDVAELSETTIVLFLETQKFAESMKDNADSLLTTYLSLQGEPYSNPDFSFLAIQIANLPTAAMNYDTFMRQTDEIRLKNNLYFYSAIIKFLQLTMDEQKDLNPADQSITAKFEQVLSNINALIDNISTIMTQMDFSVKIEFRTPMVESYIGSAIFRKKLRGYIVCREYKERVALTMRDFEFFAKKYHEQLVQQQEQEE
uniref:Receptivity factor PRFB3 n=1 Tax=Plethodon richmondi TaxID=154588 RepID=Q6RG27_9SALA|nr:receptivity factor PRFB3 [Plethodon richmondi]